MDQFAKVLQSRFKKSAMAKSIQAALVVEFFQKVVKELWGKQVEEQVQALHLKRQVLTIACINSIVAQEVKFKQAEIISKINQEFGKDTALSLKIMT